MNWLRLPLLPIHLAQVITTAKSFQKNQVLGNRWANENGLHVARVEWAQRLAERRRKALSHAVDISDQQSFERDGFVCRPDFLPKEVFRAVVDEVENSEFERHDMLQGQTVTRRGMLDSRDVHDRPGLRAVLENQEFAALVRYVASHAGQPLLTLQAVMARGTSPAGAWDVDPQTLLHSDTFHPTAKAWLFLRDVGPDDGPFLYVPGSHRMTKERYDWEKGISVAAHDISNRYAAKGSLRITESDVGLLGYGAPRHMLVKANTLVVADTHGFHARAVSSRSTTRIEIYSSLRRNPFLPVTASALGGLHFASLPPLRNRMNRGIIEALRISEQLGLRGNPWTRMGSGALDEWPASLPLDPEPT